MAEAHVAEKLPIDRFRLTDIRGRAAARRSSRAKKANLNRLELLRANRLHGPGSSGIFIRLAKTACQTRSLREVTWLDSREFAYV